MRFGLPPVDRRTWTDAVAIGVSALMGVALAHTVHQDSPVPPAAVLTVCLLLAATLAWRRTRPLAVLWTTVGAGALAIAAALVSGPLFATDAATHSLAWFPPTAPFVAYTAASRCAADRLLWASLGALAAVSLLTADPTGVSGAGLRTFLFTSLAAATALYLSTHRSLVGALNERAERAEKEQHLLTEQARAEERARLAGEMHDIVTHRVSLIVLQAGALRVTATDEAVRSAAEDLRATGYRALGELRDLTGVLSRGHGPEPLTDPDPGALVEDTRRTGTPVDLETRGDPSLASPLVAATLYRLLQESLTNARKHAPGARVSVLLSYGPTAVRLLVRNSAPTRAPDPDLVASGSGRGLAGLLRRTELLGGTLTAGPADSGGFEVQATLPAHVPFTERAHP
ncbi:MULTISPECIES: sensor histidine kinase [unclassified Nocardiopsis]|uniref:sensor histidine kinase n=1 Tax=Nocardiopsis TaxID=2013 RepID=UPI00387B62D8